MAASAKRATQRLTTPSFLTAMRSRPEMTSSKRKAFFILPSQLFCSVRSRAPLDENLNETLEAVFQAIEDSAKGSDSEANFSGLFDDIDVNSNKLGGTVAERNKRLVKLMNGVGDMKLGDYRDNTIDAFGDAYEYPHGHVRLQRGQERRRILHAAGGVRAAHAYRRRRKDRNQQGL